MLGRTGGNGHVLGFVGAHSVLDLPDVPRVEMTYGCGSVFSPSTDPGTHRSREHINGSLYQTSYQRMALAANACSVFGSTE